MSNANLLLPEDSVNVSIGEGADLSEILLGRRPPLPKLLPLLAVKDMSMFPRMVLPMLVSDPRHQGLVDEVLSGDKIVGLVALKGDIDSGQVKNISDIHQVGVAALILQMAKSERDGLRLVAQGLTRFKVLELLRTEPYLMAHVEAVEDIITDDLESKALLNNLRSLFRRVLELAPHLPDELGSLVASVDHPGALCDMVASAMNISAEERQSIVEALDVSERLRRVTTLLNREIQVLELGSKIQDQVKEGLDKTQREYYLRQQLKAIKEELGEGETEGGETDEMRRRLEEKALPDQVRAEAERELKRLEGMHSSSAEYNVITTYLDWILNLPWEEQTEDHLEIKQARAILEADHYDLDKVKRRILEYLAVRKLNPNMKGPILCFVGPPGVGKTSLGRSIARALGRKFARISLGGGARRGRDPRPPAHLRGGHARTHRAEPSAGGQPQPGVHARRSGQGGGRL